MAAVEFIDAADNTIPEWQQKEVLSRLEVLNDHPETGVDWNTAIKRIKQLQK